MKNKKLIISLTLGVLAVAAQAATVTVTVEDDGVSNIGANGTFYWALTNCSPGDTINFNIPGSGVHYLKPPVNGFPLLYHKHGVTINGYSQAGSAANTAAITATNNAVIKIVLDSRNGNFTDMAYVYYGTKTTPVPPIDNSQLYGDGSTTSTGRERGGYDPDTVDPYAPGEVATLGIYRSTNVTIRGLAFIAGGISAAGYSLAVAQDFEYDTAVKDRFAYDRGTCRGFHVAGCWFGIDPGTGADAGNGAALTMFRHRDRNGLTAATQRPAASTDPNGEGVPNGENAVIGVAPGVASPRAEFNVFGADFEGSIGAELARTRVSGNQILSPTDIGRYSDTQVPCMLFGTDGDGVNDADEGNLFVQTLSMYNSQTKVVVIAGNTFNLERDGSRPGTGFFAVDGLGLDQGGMFRFGSDMNGVGDAFEGNKVYDSAFNANASGSAASNGSWVSARRNSFINCVNPIISGSQLTFYGKFMDASVTAKPTVDLTSTVSSLKGTCSTNLAPYSRVYIDLYVSDPEGDTAGDPQGKTYLGTFEDNGPGDSNPAIGAFTFNISSLSIAPATKVTLTANYSNESKPSISAISVAGGNVTLSITNGTPAYNILQASALTGPWTGLGLAKLQGAVTVPASGAASYYRVTGTSFAQQTSPFADSVTLLP
jgi:hypothetical protein